MLSVELLCCVPDGLRCALIICSGSQLDPTSLRFGLDSQGSSTRLHRILSTNGVVLHNPSRDVRLIKTVPVDTPMYRYKSAPDTVHAAHVGLFVDAFPPQVSA